MLLAAEAEDQYDSKETQEGGDYPKYNDRDLDWSESIPVGCDS